MSPYHAQARHRGVLPCPCLDAWSLTAGVELRPCAILRYRLSKAYAPALVSSPAVGSCVIMTPRMQPRWRYHEESTDVTITQDTHSICGRARSVGRAGVATGHETFIDLQDMITLTDLIYQEAAGSQEVQAEILGIKGRFETVLASYLPPACLGPFWRPSYPPSTPILACGLAWRCTGSGARRLPNVLGPRGAMRGLRRPRWRQPALRTALVLWPIWSRIRVAHSLLASVAWPWAGKSPLLAPIP